MIPNAIPFEEVEFHPLSFADSNGRVFWWKGELYRGISQERQDLYSKLLEPGVVQNLIKKGLLVETEVTPFSLNGYPLILKHQVVPFVSYVHEWPSLMLKDAALAVIDIAIELAQEGLTLQDAHPWNILFNGSKPIFVDFGSIIPARPNTQWPAAGEFYRYFVYPLRLMSDGHSRIARLLLHDYEQGVLQFECDALAHTPFRRLAKEVVRTCVPAAIRPGLKRLLNSLGSLRSSSPSQSSGTRLQFLKKIRRDVEKINIDFQKSNWSHYYEEGSFPSFSPSSEWTAKHQSVYNILSTIRPSSVLDIGSNRGWHSRLAASLGMNIVAFDTDETAINRLYCDVRDENAPILPLVMDIREPSPPNQIAASAVDRLQCDLVLALALVHHLVFKHFLRFDKIVAKLASFTKRTLVLEFIPKEDQFVSKWWSPKYDWYTIENLIAELRQYFRNVSVHPSDPKPRVLLLCEK
jgi:23S rRNA U2552 (ribose-2'-O)-methylase RlmE/FtsJ